jgi:hypothetical protein
MRLYAPDEEERIALQTSVRDWTRSKLLDPSQRVRLEPDLRTDLRRTNTALRIALAVFTVLIAVASVSFVVLALGLKGSRSLEITVGVTAAILYLGLAEALVRRLRLYRFGVEEALSILAVVAFAMSVSTWINEPLRVSMVAGLLSAAAGGLWLFGRFGFVYGAMGSAVCVAAIPFQLDLPYATTRSLAAAAFAVVCAVAHLMRRDTACEIRRAEYEDLRAAAWAGVYLVLNLQLTLGEPEVGRVFYWFTYALTWALPAAGLWIAVREKDRALLGVGLIIALITLMTNKPYLHWAHHPWDPMIFGIMLTSAALGIRRWLSTGPGGARNGFTPQRLLDSETRALHVLGTVALGVQPVGVSLGHAPHASPRSPDGFDGGRSGGAGGGASY